MSKKIVVIGSSNVDLIMKMDRLPKRGETVTNALFLQTFGGKGANQAVAAAMAMASSTKPSDTDSAVYFVNCVGDDSYGKQVTENLRCAGVNVDHVFSQKDTATGTALIMIGGEGENYLGVAPGANYCLTRTQIDQARDLIASADLVMLQFEIQTDTLKYAFDTACQMGKPIIFNLAPPQMLEDEYIAQCEVFIANETEAEFICGFPVDSPSQVVKAAGAIQAKGAKAVIITLGSAGAYVAAPHLQKTVPAFKVKAVDTTAAGDVFCGALAAAWVEGRSLLEAVRFANAAAAICVTRMGAQSSIPDRSEIDTFMTTALLPTA
jgi:ribokinase